MGGLHTRRSFSLGCQVLANGTAVRVGQEGRHGLSIMSLPFPEANGIPAEEKAQSGPPPHRVYFLQSHYNAAFISLLDFYFSKHFPMCGLL